MAKPRLIICPACDSRKYVRLAFMKTCHDCTNVRGLRGHGAGSKATA